MKTFRKLKENLHFPRAGIYFLFPYISRSLRCLCLVIIICLITFEVKGQSLNDLYKPKPGVSANALQYKDITIEPGKEIELANFTGAGLITYFYITDNSNGHIYPGLVLNIYWDNSKDPSVNVPLGDFFGAIDGRVIDYESVIMQINHYCYMSYLPMPFSKGARIVLANDGEKVYKRSVAYGVDYIKDPSYGNNEMRLHCYYKRTNPTNGKHELLNIKGDGHYIGNFLQVYTKYKRWWGEGDTDFKVDGAPLKHTPGTEDEYGSCWGFEHTYSYMYSGYIENTNGENRMYRWYLANPVVFKKELNVTIQNQHYCNSGQVDANDDYRSISFWYQRGANPVQLQPYQVRIAPSNAMEY